MHDIGGRGNQNHFDALGWYQLQSFGTAVVFRCDAAVVRLPESVEAKLLFETGRSRGERCGPVRLLRLCLVHALEPACEVPWVASSAGIRTSLRIGRNRREKKNSKNDENISVGPHVVSKVYGIQFSRPRRAHGPPQKLY